MKNKVIYLLLASASLFFACEKEIDTSSDDTNDVSGLREVTFIASMDAATKASFDAVNRVFAWDNNDPVKFYDGTNTVTANNKSTKGDAATFTVAVSGSDVTALFPSGGSITSWGVVEGTITNNTPVAEGVANGFPMMAVAKDISDNNVNELVFRNIGGLVKFTLDDALTDVSGVTIATNSAAKGYVKFVGGYRATVDENGNMTVANTSNPEDGNAGTFVDFNASGDANLSTGKPYFITVLPATLTNGFNFIIKRRENPNIEIDATRPVTFASSKIVNLGTLSASTMSSEFSFADDSEIKEDGVIRNWNENGQLSIKVKNPSKQTFTCDFALFEDGVKVAEATDISNEANLNNGYAGNVYLQGGSSAANQIWLRNFGDNTTDKTRLYQVTIKPASGTPIVAKMWKYGQNGPKLTVSSKRFAAGYSATALPVTITSKSAPWTISSATPEVTFSESSSSEDGNKNITINVPENTGAAREIIVLVSTEATVLEKTHEIVISQLAYGENLEFPAESWFYPNSASKFSGVSASAIASYEVASDKRSATLVLATNAGIGGALYFDGGIQNIIDDKISVRDKGGVAGLDNAPGWIFNFNIYTNDTDATKNYTVVFEAMSSINYAVGTFTLNIVQPADTAPSLSVDNASPSVSAATTSHTVVISAHNVTWNAEWVSGFEGTSLSPTSGTGNLTVSFPANETTDPVHYKVNLTGEGVSPIVIDITQAAAGGATPTYTYELIKSVGWESGNIIVENKGYDPNGAFWILKSVKLGGVDIDYSDDAVVTAVLAQAFSITDPGSDPAGYESKTWMEGQVYVHKVYSNATDGLAVSPALGTNGNNKARLAWLKDDGTELGYVYMCSNP